jgi:hypothetical protein
MNKRDLLRKLRARQTPERTRATAYHEAGHAAIKFLFGEQYNIHFIDIRGNVENAAYVRTRGEGPLADGNGFHEADPATRWFIKINTKGSMMFDLAGYAAQHRVSTEDYDGLHWLDTELDDPEWECIEIHDINRAVTRAKTLHGDTGNAWRLLRQMARWTDEALAHPRLWAVVVALAERLATAKRRMSGDTVCRIMDGAWGKGTLPYIEMGSKWRRRFSVPRALTQEGQP